MKRSTLFFVCLFLGLSLHLSAQRGTVINAVPVTTVTPEEIMQTLQGSLDATAYSLVDLFTYKKHSVTAVKVDFSKSAAPLTVSTRFGTRSARRWYWFSTWAHWAWTF